MTVPATSRRAGPYSGNGVTTSFGFSFKLFDDADIRVVELDTETGIETVAVLNSDYTVSLNPDQESNPGGNVVYGVAPATGTTVTIVGDIDYGQPTDLPDGGAYRAQQVEDGMDRLAMQIQQLAEESDRTLRLAVSTDNNVSVELPAPSALSVIGWDDTGLELRNFTPGDIGVAVSYAEWRTELFDGTGAQTDFELAYDAGNASNIDLRVNNVPQTPGVNFSYTAATKTIAFLTGAPSAGTDNVVARYGQALPQGATPDLDYGSIV